MATTEPVLFEVEPAKPENYTQKLQEYHLACKNKINVIMVRLFNKEKKIWECFTLEGMNEYKIKVWGYEDKIIEKNF